MLRPATWPCPDSGSELALVSDQCRNQRILVAPALFDEANKMRHFTIEVMRHLNAGGIDCFLPDLAGCNESSAPLSEQDLSAWRKQMEHAAAHFRASHLISIRAGAMLCAVKLPGFRYGPVTGASVLRSLLRARIITAREAGQDVTREQLLEDGLREGLTLAGYQLGPQMIAQLQSDPLPPTLAEDLPQSMIGGAGLWLRAEPDHDVEQAKLLAQIVMDSFG